MRAFPFLLKTEAILLHRNGLLIVSMVLTAAYIGLFQLLKMMGYKELFAILLILNDPAMIAFLFIGVTILFEREAGTLDALKVSPINIHQYLWAKLIVLSALGMACAWAMAVGLLGFQIEHLGFLLTAFMTALLFANLGIIFVSTSKRFIDYMLKMAGILFLMVLPIFDWFGIFQLPFKAISPVEHVVRLFAWSFHYEIRNFPWLSMAILSASIAASYFIGHRIFTKKLVNQ